MFKKTLLKPACALAVTALASLTSSQAYTVTNSTTGYFNTGDGYTGGGVSLTDEPNTSPASEQFQTTDPYNGINNTGDNTAVTFLGGTTLGGGLGSGSGNNSVVFGGLTGYGPGITNQAFYRNFTSVVGGDPQDTVTFSIDYRVAAGSDSIFDNWSFDLRNSAGNLTLLNVLLDARTNPGQIDIYANGVGIGFYDNTGGPLINISATLQNNGWTLDVANVLTTTNLGGDVLSFITNAPSQSGAGLLAGGGTAADFQSYYISWLLENSDVADYGENSLIVNTINVTSDVIPEPGTWAVGALLLGGVAASIYRRRKLATASVES